MARYGVRDFSSFVSCKNCIACLTLSEKRASEAALVVANDTSDTYLLIAYQSLSRILYLNFKL